MTKADAQQTGMAQRYVAFSGANRIATGSLDTVAMAARRQVEADPNAVILAFDRESGAVVDLDLRGSDEEVAARYAPEDDGPSKALAQRRGRPKLGVISREVTLLPRHWDWLAQQPGGASITLRKLVEAAQKSDNARLRARLEAAYRFMATMAGDRPGFEEAARALFANGLDRLAELALHWPADVAEELLAYARSREPSSGSESGQNRS